MPAELNTNRKLVIGMVHLKALPGSPAYRGDMDDVLSTAIGDALALEAGGVDAVLLENFHDVPFFKASVPACTVAAITACAMEVRGALAAERDVPVGINVLRNDGCAALSVAVAAGATMIRVNVLTAARVTDQGIVEGISAELLRLRRMIGAGNVRILADVDVKHSAPLAARPIEEEVLDTVERGGADALIVSGTGTGKPTDPGHARRVRASAPAGTPVYVGSGLTLDSVDAFRDVADGFIVGTHFKHHGKVDQPVDGERVRAFVQRVRG